MSCTSHSVDSSVWVESSVLEGVRFRVARMSLGRRIELARRMREIGRRVEFLEASESTGEKIEAAVARGEVERAYVEWGLLEIQGLAIDGEAASAASLVERGPVALTDEVVAAVRRECGLSDDERKN